jgi:hypothetical protein
MESIRSKDMSMSGREGKVRGCERRENDRIMSREVEKGKRNPKNAAWAADGN